MTLLSQFINDNVNFMKICRLCLHQDQVLIDIFASTNTQENDLASKIMACVSVEILPADDGPQKICEKCLYIVDNWVKFKDLCENTSAILKQYLSKSKATVNPIDLSQYSESGAAMIQMLAQKEMFDITQVSTPDVNLLEQDCSLEYSLLERMENDEGASNMSSVINFCFGTKEEVNDKEVKKQDIILPTTFIGIKNPAKEPLTNEVEIDTEMNNEYDLEINKNDNQTAEIVEEKVEMNVPPEDMFVQNVEENFVVKHIRERRKRNTVKKIYLCEFCKSTFTRFCDLVKHDDTVHTMDLKNSVCSECGRMFISDTRLRTHLELHREKLFRCEKCLKMFSSKKSLSVHFRLHTGKYKCDSCDYRATSKVHLLNHKNTHFRIFETFCDICDKVFSSSNALNRHKESHNLIPLKWYKCNKCSYTCKQSCDLKSHMTTHGNHTLFMCEKCGINCKTRRILNTHMARHQDPSYLCVICEKLFVTKYELERHKQTHTDMKNFTCNFCNKTFCYRHTLKRHLKKMSNNK